VTPPRTQKPRRPRRVIGALALVLCGLSIFMFVKRYEKRTITISGGQVSLEPPWTIEGQSHFTCGSLSEEECWKALRERLGGAHWEQGGGKFPKCFIPDSRSHLNHGCLDHVLEHL
jgi:hypothetical protein